MKCWSTLLSSTTCPYILPSWNYWLAWGPTDLVLRAIFVHKHQFRESSCSLGTRAASLPWTLIFCTICSSQEHAKLCWSCRVPGCIGPQDGPASLWSRILIPYFLKLSKATITSMFLYYAPAVSCTFFIPEWSFCIGMIYIVHSAVQV